MRAARQRRPGSARKGHRQDMLGLVPDEGRCCPPPDGFAIVPGARLERRFQAPNTPPRQEPRTSIGIDFPQSAHAGKGNSPRPASSSGESNAVPAQGRAVTREVMELCRSRIPGAAGSRKFGHARRSGDLRCGGWLRVSGRRSFPRGCRKFSRSPRSWRVAARLHLSMARGPAR